jgi:YD repeat-containing protein
LVKILNRICDSQNRPSFLILWSRRDGSVSLGLHEGAGIDAEVCLLGLHHLLASNEWSATLGVAGTAYVTPPCVLVPSRPAWQRADKDETLDAVMGSDGLEGLLHCLAATECQLLMRSPLFDPAKAVPTGTALDQKWEAVKQNPSQWNVNRFVSELRVQPPEVQRQYVQQWQNYGAGNRSWASTAGLRVDNGVRWNSQTGLGSFFWKTQPDATKLEYGRNVGVGVGPLSVRAGDSFGWETRGGGLKAWNRDVTLTNYDTFTKLRLASPPPAGGILFEPNIEVVVDRDGLTGKLAAQAVSAVKGQKAGAPLSYDGRQYLAVRAPGTRNLFQVTAGRFTAAYSDIAFERASAAIPHRLRLGLSRYYNSAMDSRPPFGAGWSVVPFSLKLDRTGVTQSKPSDPALTITLVDHRSCMEFRYQVDREHLDPNWRMNPTALDYRKMKSALQPDLAVETDGHYRIGFSHGLLASFDHLGNLEWIGDSEDNCTRYTYKDQRLVAVASDAGKIDLSYDDSGFLVSATASNGAHVTYRPDTAGRLAQVVDSSGLRHRYTYDNLGRLVTMSTGPDADHLALTAENTYDPRGRTLSRKSGDRLLRFSYDDRTGKMLITGADGQSVTCFYDMSERLVASGTSPKTMTLFNYDVTGRIIQVADGELLNDPSTGEWPRFKVGRVLGPSVENKKENRG